MLKDRVKWQERKLMPLLNLLKTYGAKGLAYIAMHEDGTIKSSFAKFMTEEEMNNLISRYGWRTWRFIVICCR